MNNASLNKGAVKSNRQYLVTPPAALNTAVHLLLMACTRFARSCCEMLSHSSSKARQSPEKGTFLFSLSLYVIAPTVDQALIELHKAKWDHHALSQAWLVSKTCEFRQAKDMMVRTQKDVA